MSDLTEIVKQHYETGCYGAAHLRMQLPSFDEIKRAYRPPAPSPFDGLQQLMSIPIVVDEDVPAGEWRLVDNSTGETLATGATQVGGGE